MQYDYGEPVSNTMLYVGITVVIIIIVAVGTYTVYSTPGDLDSDSGSNNGSNDDISLPSEIPEMNKAQAGWTLKGPGRLNGPQEVKGTLGGIKTWQECHNMCADDDYCISWAKNDRNTCYVQYKNTLEYGTKPSFSAGGSYNDNYAGIKDPDALVHERAPPPLPPNPNVPRPNATAGGWTIKEPAIVMGASQVHSPLRGYRTWQECHNKCVNTDGCHAWYKNPTGDCYFQVPAVNLNPTFKTNVYKGNIAGIKV